MRPYFCRRNMSAYRDPFGYPKWAKRLVILVFGVVTWYRMNRVNKLHVKGAEHIADLDEHNVLFVSNHQTYFMDVASMLLAMFHVHHGMLNRADRVWPFLRPRTNIYYIAAKETMKGGLLPRLLALSGSVSIKRTWREAGQNIQRGVDPSDVDNIRKAIRSGWVITFPQGTTKPYVKGRRGTAHLITELEPIVVPIVIDGYRRAFDKKGLRLKKRGVDLSMTFKAPITYDQAESPQEIMDRIMDAIEQSPKYQHPFRNLDA